MRGKGCEQCRHTGYQGRAAIYEICVVTEPLRKLIMQKKDGGELKQCAIAEGMETLRQDGWRRVAKGNTTIEEVVRVTRTYEVLAETTEDAQPVVQRYSVSAQVADLFSVTAAAENRSPGDENVGAVLNRDACRLRIDSAIHFDVDLAVACFVPFRSAFHFFHLLGAE